MKTIRAAEHLHKMGYGKNDIIGIVAKNHHHLAPIVFASFAIAAPISPMDPNFIAGKLYATILNYKGCSFDYFR